MTGDPSDFKHIEILLDEYEMHLALPVLESDDHVFAGDCTRTENENEHVFAANQTDQQATTRENEHVFATMEGESAPRAEIG